MSEVLTERVIGPLTILFGRENGKYPQGNTLVVKGQKKTVMIDPSLGVVDRKANLPDVDMVLLTHVHEDHIAGLHLFPEASCFAHAEDAQGLASLSGLMEIFGYEGEPAAAWKASVVEDYFYQSRPDVQSFSNGDKFDLGGVSIEIIHTPGHTRGHSCLLIDWENNDERLCVLGDIDLTSFGPYYGDGWSSLVDFEQSLELLKSVEAHWWLTFHHKGLIEGRGEFLTMLEKYSKMIDSRESRLLAYLSEPRSLDQIVEHQFIYRPGTGGVMVDQIERRSMRMHLERLLQSQEVLVDAAHRWQAR